MQLAVLAPVGDGDVRHIEAGLISYERKDVAVVHAVKLLAAFAQLRGGYVMLGAGDVLLCLAYGWQETVATGIAQGGVEVGVCGHKVNDLLLLPTEKRTVIGPQFAGYAMTLHIIDCGRVIMVARGIAIDDAILVSHEGEIAAIISKFFLALKGGDCEVTDGLNEGGAVQFARIDNKLFLSCLRRLDIVSLKGSCDIRKPQKLARVEELQIGTFRLLKSEVEELLNSDGIFGLVDDILALGGVGEQSRKDEYKYNIMYAHKWCV